MARFGSLDTQYFDDAGDPLVSGKIYFYETGTTTPKNTYADINYTIPNSNPVILTAAGRQPNIFFDGVAKAILTKSDNTQILVRDPVGDTASTFGNAWIASKDYNANDVVQGSDGEFYVSLINGNVNNNPVTTTGSWTFLYSVEWNAGTTYKLGSVVTYETIVYQSLQNANLNQNPSTATTYWVPIQLVWSSTATYAINANVVGTDGILYTSLQNANTNHTPASSPSWWVGTSAAAASSASAAAASASAASTSASNAATSESNAAASASTASTQATNASNYASAASTSATNASNSASAASTSASNAASSASSAAASYDLFDDRYLGAKSSDPTVDNDGNPLVTGAMYFNTVSNTTRIYNGSGWQDSAAIATSINLASQVTGTLPVANGGTGATTLTANNVLLGNGTSAVQFVAPGASGNVLTSNGTTWASSAASSSNLQEFTTSGTWTKPANATFVMVEALGAGGGGGSGQIAAAGVDQWGGTGGGGGAYAYRVFKASELASSIAVTVGAGGVGGAAKTGTSESGAAGTAGGNSSFGPYLTAYRGDGGPGGSASQNGGVGGGVLGTSGQPANNGGNVSSGTFQGAFGLGGGAMGNSASRTYSSGFGGGGGGGQGTKGSVMFGGAPGGGSYQGGAGGGAGASRSSVPVDNLSGEGGSYFNGDSGGVPVGRYGAASSGFLPRLGGAGGRLKETVSSAAFVDIAYGDSKFVSTISGGLICVSSDNGATWTLQAASQSITPARIYYLNGQWCFLSSTLLAVSSNLSSYSVSIITNSTAMGYYSGTYVLVGASGSIQTSTDLITWTVRSSGTSQNLQDVIHDGSRWIVVGSSGVSLTSTDAVTWTLVTTTSSGNWSRVASSGSVFVATSSVSPYAWRSTDSGATWTGVSTTLTAGSQGRVIYAGSQFVFCSASDVWTSAAGNTWTQQTDGLADSYPGIAYSGSAYAICSSTSNSTVAITSPTGTTWTQRTFSSVNFTNTPGGSGGIAAGGGGGSAAQNGDTGGSGAGGNGGDGLVRVYTW